MLDLQEEPGSAQQPDPSSAFSTDREQTLSSQMLLRQKVLQLPANLEAVWTWFP